MSIKRISELPAYVDTQVESTVFVPVDKTGAATQKYPLSSFIRLENVKVLETIYPILNTTGLDSVFITRPEFQTNNASIYAEILLETNNRIAADSLLAPKSSPVFSGVPTAPTPSLSDSSDRIATTSYVKGVVADFINSGVDLGFLTDRLDVLEAGAYQKIHTSTSANIVDFVAGVSGNADVVVGDSVLTADGSVHMLRFGGTKTNVADWIEIKIPNSVLSDINTNISSISSLATHANDTASAASTTANSAYFGVNEVKSWGFSETSDAYGNLTINYGTNGASIYIPIATTNTAGLMSVADKTSLANKSDVGHVHVISDVSGLQGQLDALAASIGGITISGVVKYDSTQTLTNTEKATARTNIGAVPVFSVAQETSSVTLSAGAEFSVSIPAATTSVSGVMTAADKTSLTNVVSLAGNAVLYTTQTLTTPQKTQARSNIAAIGVFGITTDTTSATLSDGGALSVVIPEATGAHAGLLSASDKTLINTLAAAGGAVLYSSAQILTTPQKTQARTNIDAVGTSELSTALSTKVDTTTYSSAISTIQSDITKRVRYDAPQALTIAEKEQARTNIGVTTPYIYYPIHGEINGFVGKQSFILCDSDTITNMFTINTTISGTPTLKKFYIDSGVLKSYTPSYNNEVLSITTIPSGKPTLITWYVSGNVVRITVDGVVVHDFTYSSISSYDLRLFGMTGKLYMAGTTDTELSALQLSKLLYDSWDEGVSMFIEFYGRSGISDTGYWVGAVKQTLMNEYSGIPSSLTGRKIAIRCTCNLPEITIPGHGSGVNEFSTTYTNSVLKINANTPVYTGLSITNITQGIILADAFVATNNNITFRFVNNTYGDITTTPTIDILYYI